MPYHFAWAAVDGADGYNVYIDGVYVTKVTENVADLDASMFTKGAGEYTVGVATVKENKTSAITSIKYTYAGSGQPATTKAPEPSTAKPTDVTVAPTAPGQDIDESIQAGDYLLIEFCHNDDSSKGYSTMFNRMTELGILMRTEDIRLYRAREC